MLRISASLLAMAVLCSLAVDSDGSEANREGAAVAPPSPKKGLPPIPACPTSKGECQLLGSDAFSEDDRPEHLPECHPLPYLDPIDVRLTVAPAPLLRVAAVQSSRRATLSVRGCPQRFINSNHASTAKLEQRELTPIEHVRQAAQHLEAAGETHEHFRHLSHELREAAEHLQRDAAVRLLELQSQAEEIRREIEEIERLSGLDHRVRR